MDHVTGINAAERSAYANGQEAAQAEIARLRAALAAVLEIFNSPRRYKVRDSRRIIEAALDIRR